MFLKILGAAFIVIACGSVGFKIAAVHRCEEKALRQLVRITDYFECELLYHLTPLPMLCRQVGREFSGQMGAVFQELALQMQEQVSPDPEYCMATVLNKNKHIPEITKSCLELLGKSMGRFDLDGQKRALEGVRLECRRQLELLSINCENRLRSYQTLGLCVGAALAILFI